MARKANGGGHPSGFWDWFLIGAATGVVYNLFKNPGGLACCGCFALVLAIILGIVAWVLIAEYYIWFILIAIVFFGWRIWVRYRKEMDAEDGGL